MKSLKSKILINLLTTALPMAAGLVAIPMLIKGLGLEQFGLLTIAWMLVGYFGLLDLGLGRSLTQKVASAIGDSATDTLKSLITQVLLVIFGLGILAGIGFHFLSHWLVFNFLNITDVYKVDTFKAFQWIALTIPLVMLSSTLMGVLEGMQRFGWAGLVRAPVNFFMFFAPVLAMYLNNTLSTVIASLFVVRLVGLCFLSWIVAYNLKEFGQSKALRREFFSVLKFGGWVSVSNLISPAMVYFDRFYIGAMLTVSVVAYYTTPFDFLTKLLVIPFAIVGVMFASFSTDWLINKSAVRQNFLKTLFAVAALMLPVSIVLFFFAKELLVLWLGQSFAENSFFVAKFLSVGIFVNALATVPFAYIQAIGRADLTAKLHLFELPLYFLLLWWCVGSFGLEGAAIAWVLRVTLDAVLLFWVAEKKFKVEKGEVRE